MISFAFFLGYPTLATQIIYCGSRGDFQVIVEVLPVGDGMSTASSVVPDATAIPRVKTLTLADTIFFPSPYKMRFFPYLISPLQSLHRFRSIWLEESTVFPSSGYGLIGLGEFYAFRRTSKKCDAVFSLVGCFDIMFISKLFSNERPPI